MMQNMQHTVTYVESYRKKRNLVLSVPNLHVFRNIRYFFSVKTASETGPEGLKKLNTKEGM